MEQPEIELLDLWHELSKEHCGYAIEVVTKNRRELPETAACSGEVNVALPRKRDDGSIIMVVALEIKDGQFDEVVWTHELGHRILDLQGFPSMRDETHPLSIIEIFLNSLAQHRPLYSLQRNAGLDPQKEIDRRAAHNVRIYAKIPEPPKRIIQIQNALIFVDDMLSCDNALRDQLKDVIRDRHPKTERLVTKVLDVCSHYDLYKIDPIRRMLRRIVQELRLGSRWVYADNRESFRLMCQE